MYLHWSLSPSRGWRSPGRNTRRWQATCTEDWRTWVSSSSSLNGWGRQDVYGQRTSARNKINNINNTDQDHARKHTWSVSVVLYIIYLKHRTVYVALQVTSMTYPLLWPQSFCDISHRNWGFPLSPPLPSLMATTGGSCWPTSWNTTTWRWLEAWAHPSAWWVADCVSTLNSGQNYSFSIVVMVISWPLCNHQTQPFSHCGWFFINKLFSLK